jgi:hypothetical protein
MRFVYDNPRQVPGEYNPDEYIAQISPQSAAAARQERCARPGSVRHRRL